MSLIDLLIDRWLKNYAGTITRRIDALENRIMTTLNELQTKLDDINMAIGEERAEVQALLGDLRAQIQVLQDQINAGQLVTQEQLDALGSAADAIVARVRDISEPVAP